MRRSKSLRSQIRNSDDREILGEIGRLVRRIETEKAPAGPTISYEEFMRRRGTPLPEIAK